MSSRQVNIGFQIKPPETADELARLAEHNYLADLVFRVRNPERRHERNLLRDCIGKPDADDVRTLLGLFGIGDRRAASWVTRDGITPRRIREYKKGTRPIRPEVFAELVDLAATEKPRLYSWLVDTAGAQFWRQTYYVYHDANGDRVVALALI